MNSSNLEPATRNQEPDVSIIIVTWNGRRFLDDCLAAVAAQTRVNAETILVDNASTDGTVEHVRERYPWVRLVPLPENAGFSGGNNAGAREARGRLLAFLNNDTVADAGWLRALQDAIDERSGFVLAASRIVYMHDAGIIDSAGDGMLRWGGAFKRLHGAPAETAGDAREVFGVCGAAFLLPKAVFDELGGFDEDFFASHEDVDLSYRARLLGYRCRYVPAAVVRHHGSATLGRASAFAVYQGQRNLEWVYVKNTPLAILLRTLPGHLLYGAAALIHFTRGGRAGAFLHGKASALAGLPRMWRKRAAVQRTRRVGARTIWAQLDSGWLATKRREKRFDAELAGPR
jgi:GT2 family glycosyltransferase